MRFFLLSLLLLALPLSAAAVDAPAGQIQIGPNQILRGHFTEMHQITGVDNPVQTSGQFTVAPAYGLLWNMEQPFPTTSIVTPAGMVQAMGNISIKMPVKNLRHLYEMIGGALRGDWNALATDYTIRPSGNAAHWQMLLTQRPGGKHSLTYTSITVNGGRFVENIAMMQPDGNFETLNFTDVTLSSASLTAGESAAFSKGAK